MPDGGAGLRGRPALGAHHARAGPRDEGGLTARHGLVGRLWVGRPAGHRRSPTHMGGRAVAAPRSREYGRVGQVRLVQMGASTHLRWVAVVAAASLAAAVPAGAQQAASPHASPSGASAPRPDPAPAKSKPPAVVPAPPGPPPPGTTTPAPPPPPPPPPPQP